MEVNGLRGVDSLLDTVARQTQGERGVDRSLGTRVFSLENMKWLENVKRGRTWERCTEGS